MRNVVAIVLTVAMLMTTTAIVLDLASLFGAHPQLAAPASGNADRERAIIAFYDAANAVLAGEQARTLAAAVSPGVVTHPITGDPFYGPEALADLIAGLRKGGEITLDLVRIVDNGAEIAAFIEARVPANRAAREPRLWRTIDLFRIDGGTIVDYWPGAVGQSPPVPLAAAAVPVKPGDAGISLTRIALGPDAEAIDLDAPLPHLLLVESGAIAVTQERDLLIARAGEREFTLLSSAHGSEEILLPGDTLLIPDGAGPVIRNPEEAVASALSLLVAPRVRLYSQVQSLPSDVVTIMGMHDPSRIGSEFEWDSGAVTETLAIDMLPPIGWIEDTVTLRGEPIVLDPGRRLPPLPPGNLRLAIIRSGVASVDGLNQWGGSPSRVVQEPLPRLAQLAWAGDAFTIAAGKAPTITNVGATRLDLLLIEFTPGDADAEVSPAVREQ